MGAEGLLSIINDVLDISKIESGKQTLENIPFDMNDIFRNCQALANLQAKEKGITLFCYAEPSIGEKLMGDPTKLRQALLNLLSNAIKFTNHGIVKMLSYVSKSEKNKVTVHFDIKDSGIGISKEQMSRLFDPFEQADNSTTRKYGGTGLGLSITKNIIELMGGKLEVESVVGVGSKFSFELTFDVVDENINIEQNAPAAIVEMPLFSGNVLICEDNIMNQEVICEHLARVGLNTVNTINGKEAVDCIRKRMREEEKPFDLIFMDVHMPVMDGIEATQKIMAMGSKSPIVALTANIMSDAGDVYKQAGMVDYLAKPFTTQELWSCLLRHLTPISKEDVNEKEQALADEKQREKLIVNFWEDNQSTMKDINDALLANDFNSAYIYVHTLKSVATLIEKKELGKAARKIEYSLSREPKEVTKEQLDSLEFELNAVLAEIKPKIDKLSDLKNKNKRKKAFLSKQDALLLIEELEPKIKSGDLDCLNFVEALHHVEGAEELIRQIEELDFFFARDTLLRIKSMLGSYENE
jgi:CheY-like chemotaxis protein